MEKKIKIDGLENRRYSILSFEHPTFTMLVFSIETRKEYIWKKTYSEMYLVTHENYLEKLNNLTDKELNFLSGGVDFKKHFIKTFEEFNLADCFETLEENFEIFDKERESKLKFLDDEVKPKQKEIMETINSINEIGFTN